jgi:F-type H+-transporting ATPase subunit b
MDLISPGLGLVVWSTLSFLVVLFLLTKFAWKPILNSIKERESSIEEALSSAEKAKNEMAALKADNEKLLQQAKIERDAILKEARDAKDLIITEAKNKATLEANKLVAAARETINNEKMSAITEIKNQAANLAIEITEKLLKEKLKEEERQKLLMGELLEEISVN